MYNTQKLCKECGWFIRYDAKDITNKTTIIRLHVSICPDCGIKLETKPWSPNI